MKIKTKITLLDSIESIGNQMKSMTSKDESALKQKDLLKSEIQTVMDYLECTETQSMLFCAIFFLTITETSCSSSDIGNVLNCGPFEMIRLDSDMNELIKKKQIIKAGSNHNRKRQNVCYAVPLDLVELVSKGQKREPFDDTMGLFEVGEILFRTLGDYRDGDITFEQLKEEIDFYVERFAHFPAFKYLKELCLTENEKLIFIYVLTDTCQGEESIDILWGLNKYILKVQNRVELRRKFLNRTAHLVTSGVLEFNDNHYRTDQFIRFTQAATERIFEEESILFDRKTFKPGPCILIEHTSIKEKALFYDETEVKELKMFEDVIESAKYKSVIERLSEKNLPKGITTILHGYPGTGKTESVYQLARKSKRNILLVDISQIRDKYVGESEKQLKEVFNVYRRALKHFEEAPILLFNESDALISKRVNVAHSTDQMNNAMQNVLLQEMENFSGILMATTNLIHNLDSAFDRRFLFKIKFSKPSIESRSKIWKSKIDSISEEEALILAADFEFSGGQIDNITKKMLMNSLMSDKPCGINEIIEYCENELFVKKGKNKSIGFFLQTN